MCLLSITALTFKKTFWNQRPCKIVRTGEFRVSPPVALIFKGAEHYFILFYFLPNPASELVNEQHLEENKTK